MTRTLRLGAFCLFLLAALVALLGQAAWAQTNRATITGTVTDSTGAVVADVAITATNTGTNVPTKTVSNHDGIYVVPNLVPGPYSVEFKKDGFETLLRAGITLNSTEVARIDTVLQVGATSASITVTSDAPVLEMDTASMGTNMKGDIVTDLPLSIYEGGRFVEDFAVAITPGYSSISNPYTAVVNGGQYFTKEYTIDGTSGTANIRGDSMDGGPSMEAIEEVQAQTSGLDAQSAVTGGSVMSFNLKSGTNTLHGSSFMYGTNELLDANSWTNNSLGQEKDKRRSWDYGFSLSGPIHKNKTFIFGTFERFTYNDFRLNSGGASVPTPAFLQGDFSTLLGQPMWTDGYGDTFPCPASQCAGVWYPIMVQNNAGQTIQAQENMIYDPITGNQFTNNLIPSGRISPMAQKVNAQYANYAPQLGGIDNNARTLMQNTPNQTPNQFVIKMDHILRDQDHLSGSWIYDHKPRTLDDGGGVWQAGTQNGGPLSNARIQTYWEHEVRLNETHTFTPHLLNIANFTYNFDYNASVPADPGDWNSTLGFGDTGANTFPMINFADNSAYGHNETFLGSTWQGDTSGANIITGDSLTWTKGRHNLSFGGDISAHQVNSRSGSGAYSFNFSYLNTAGAGYPYDGFGFATYMLGLANQGSESVPYNLYGRQKGISLFAQDSYKMNSKLTVNLGVRWNYNTRFHEKYGNWANFDQSAISPQYGLPGTLVFAKNGGDSFEKDEYAKNFGPTLGIAYQLLPKTVLHASYGLIFNPVGVAFDYGVPDQFAPQLGANEASNFSWDAAGGGPNYPGVVKKANVNTDPSTMSPFPVSVDPRALKLGYSEAFNVGIQQQLTPNTRLEVSYVGNRGHHLTDTALAWNETSTSNFLNLVNANPGINAFNDYIYCPAVAGPSPSTYGVPCPIKGYYGPAMAMTAPMPQMAAGEVTYWYYANLQYVGLPLGQSFYDSLVVDVVKRMGRGLAMDMSYDWSRQEGDSYSAQQEGNGFYTGVQDFSKMREVTHAVTGYDLPQVVKGFVSYQLPIGKGQQWLAGQNPVVNGIVSGWTVTGMVNYYTGQPFEVGAANPYWPLWGNIFPVFNLAGFKGPNNPKHYVPVGPSGAIPAQDIYMPATVASNPAAGVLPPSPVTSHLRCPGSANENISMMKNENVGPEGRYRISFHTDFYNLFNRHAYLIEGCEGLRAGIGSANFGEILGVNSLPRQGQFSIRLDF